jgi:hypothetical protein
MPKRTGDAPLGACIRPWRDTRLRLLLSHIQGLRRSRAMGPYALDRPNAKLSRARRFSSPWDWPDRFGVLILLTFTILLLRALLR